MKKRTAKKISVFGILFLVITLALPAFYFTQKAQASGLTKAMVRLDRVAASQPTTGTVCASPTTASTEAHVQVTFPAGFTVSTTVGNWTVNTTNTGWPGSPTPTAWPGIGTATAAAGQVVTFPSTDLTVGTTYCFNWANTAALSTPSSTGNGLLGSVTTQDSGPATIDSSQVAFSIITNDQISVTGTVNPTFTFSLPTNTDNFASALVNGSTTSTSGSVATITTNAHNGWTAWVKSANAALHSASTSQNISTVGTYPTITTLSAGTTGYLMKVATTNGSGGNASPAAGYTTTGSDDGGALSASYVVAAAGTAATGGDTATFTERARVASTQAPANDYTDTLTVVAAGQF